MDRISEDSVESAEAPLSAPMVENDAIEESTAEISECEDEALRIIKAILARDVHPERVSLRSGKSYKTVLLDEKPRSRIAILRFGKRKKNIEILDDAGTRAEISTPGDIYQHANELRDALSPLMSND